MEVLIDGELLSYPLSLVNSQKYILLDILLDIPRDMNPYSVFGSVKHFFYMTKKLKKFEFIY